MSNIAKRWRDLSGEKNWDGLFSSDHIDTDLRRYLIHYCERAQAMNDAFNGETKSKNCGLSRYGPKVFFSKVALENGNPFKYEVTAFFYAAFVENVAPNAYFKRSTSPDAVAGDSNWIGYVAVATNDGASVLGRRDILVVWRGSKLTGGLVKDFETDLVPATDILGTSHNPKVHKGWFSIYTATNNTEFNRTSARDQVFSEVKRLVARYANEEISITVTGHSMGAALATLNAVDLVYNKVNQQNNAFTVTAFSFASPRIGDKGFNDVFTELHNANFRILRINEHQDIVPHFPLSSDYVDVGQVLDIEAFKSPYLKTDIITHVEYAHSLELLMHGIAGYQGTSNDFKLVVDRDLALINKDGDLVLDANNIIGNWWTEKNKDMVQNDDGFWELKDDQKN